MTMTPHLLGFHIVLAMLLFSIVNWIGKHSTAWGYLQLSLAVRADDAPAFNFVIRVLTPVVYLIIASAILYAAGLDSLVSRIYLVIIYYFILRVAYNVVLGRTRLMNWRLQIAYAVIGSGLAYAAYKYLIAPKTHLQPNWASMGNQLWIVIFGFIYVLLNQMNVSISGAERRRMNYLLDRYSRYRQKFGDLIEAKVRDRDIEILIFAVMIYEAFNRPKVYRIIEACLFRVGIAKTLGIMQVRSTSYISDEQSVAIACDIIATEYRRAVEEQKEKTQRYPGEREYYVLHAVLMKYNPSESYVSEVRALYDTLRKGLSGGGRI